MKIVILTDADIGRKPYHGENMVLAADMVIVKRDMDFDITKSRFGMTYTKLPIELLSNVINYPHGEIKMIWEKKSNIEKTFEEFFKE